MGSATLDDAEFLRAVETGDADFLDRRSKAAPPPDSPPQQRSIGMRLDDRFGTSPLMVMVLVSLRRYGPDHLRGIFTVVGWMIRPYGRKIMRSRRAARKRRSDGPR
jgi:hypothetical protein